MATTGANAGTVPLASMGAANAPPAVARPAAAAPVADDDALERETLLVAEARGALMRGNPNGSLSAVRAARAQTSHALEPEEMSLEAKALRALGRPADAAVVEAQLRARFPDHALAR
jgi:hypothetical protein